MTGHTIPFFGMRSTRTLWLVLGAMFVLLCMPLLANAQAGRGSISGAVTDPSGAVVPGAQVELLSKATGVKLHTVTSGAGLYTFISLNPGAYQVTLTQKGFSKVVEDNIKVSVDQVTEVNLSLQVGAVTDTVTVIEGAELRNGAPGLTVYS